MRETEKLWFLLDLQRKISSEIGTLKLELDKKIEELKFVDTWIETFPICQSCNGHGVIHVSYTNDDVRYEKCQSCDGSGLIKKK
jgi:formate dehydrogenase maturation protein FdhE